MIKRDQRDEWGFDGGEEDGPGGYDEVGGGGYRPPPGAPTQPQPQQPQPDAPAPNVPPPPPGGDPIHDETPVGAKPPPPGDDSQAGGYDFVPRRPPDPFGFGPTGGPDRPPRPPVQPGSPGYKPQSSWDLPGFEQTVLTPNRNNPLDNPLQSYALNYLNAPNRYDNDMVKQGMAVIRDRMNQAREDSYRANEGYLARKGLGQSTLGAQVQADESRRLTQMENQEQFAWGKEQADAFARDREAAGRFGLDTARYGEDQYRFDRDEALRNRGLDLQKWGIDMDAAKWQGSMDQRERQFATDTALRNRAMDLQKQGMDSDEAWRQSQMEWDRERTQLGFDESQRQRDWQTGQQDDQQDWASGESEKDRKQRFWEQWGFDNMDPGAIESYLGSQTSPGPAQPSGGGSVTPTGYTPPPGAPGTAVPPEWGMDDYQSPTHRRSESYRRRQEMEDRFRGDDDDIYGFGRY